MRAAGVGDGGDAVGEEVAHGVHRHQGVASGREGERAQSGRRGFGLPLSRGAAPRRGRRRGGGVPSQAGQVNAPHLLQRVPQQALDGPVPERGHDVAGRLWAGLQGDGRGGERQDGGGRAGEGLHVAPGLNLGLGLAAAAGGAVLATGRGGGGGGEYLVGGLPVGFELPQLHPATRRVVHCHQQGIAVLLPHEAQRYHVLRLGHRRFRLPFLRLNCRLLRLDEDWRVVGHLQVYFSVRGDLGIESETPYGVRDEPVADGGHQAPVGHVGQGRQPDPGPDSARQAPGDGPGGPVLRVVGQAGGQGGGADQGAGHQAPLAEGGADLRARAEGELLVVVDAVSLVAVKMDLKRIEIKTENLPIILRQTVGRMKIFSDSTDIDFYLSRTFTRRIGLAILCIDRNTIFFQQ